MKERILSFALGLTLISGVLVPFAQVGPAAAALATTGQGAGSPNLFNPKSDATSVTHSGSSATSVTFPAMPPGTLTRTVPLPMQPGHLPLVPGKAAQFLGSDGRLEVDVAAGAVSAQDVAAAGGSLNLLITQIAPASGSNAGGSGHVSFGTYLLQVVDGQDHLMPQGLRQPVTVRFHAGATAQAFDLAHSWVLFNGGVSTQVKLASPPAILPTGASASTLRLGKSQTNIPAFDGTARTLSATVTMSTAATSASFGTNAPVASFGKPDPFNVTLNAGALTFEEPIDVPAGPGGLTPPLTLSYSSADVSEQHNAQAAASWVGEGWNLAPGAISWSEHNVTLACGSCPSEWESSWQLSDPFGTSAELIPPNINVSTYYDDTPNVYYDKSTNTYPNEPIRWHTTPESHTRIYSYVGPNTLPTMPARPSCFRVFLPNGIMEEFGCTTDSLEYYYVPSNLNSYYIANWYLDLITAPQGNQIHFTYQADTETYSGASYTRDVVLKTVEWDSPNCHNAQSACTGSSWAPLMRVNFVASHTPSRVTGHPNSNACNTASNVRCDDPLDLSGSGGLAAPQMQSTFALNDIQVQVRSSGSGSWNTLRDYQLSYEQSGPWQITDPISGLTESFAGTFDLTQIAEVGDDGSTALPTRTFGYTWGTEHYEDSAYHATPSGNCGFSWNANCYLWSRSLDGNSRYLSSASNGLGLAQTFTWAEGRNNTHGVPSGQDPTNTLYCDSNNSGYPCDLADDENWSHMVLTSQSGAVVRPSSGGNTTVTSTTSYSYKLTLIGEKPCSDCVAGMYWGNQNDADYLDFYNAKFQGYTQATVTNPDGSVEIHMYFATDGWGLYDTSQVTCYTSSPCHNAPWWHWGTLLHGREYEADYYDTDGKTLLKQIQTQYQQTCPPTGVSGTPASSTWGNWDGNLVSMLDHNNPVASCDIQTKQVDIWTFDGAGAGTRTHQVVNYSFDSYGRNTSATTTNDARVEAESLPIVSHTAPISVQGNCCGVTWSGNAQLFFQPTSANNSFTLSFAVPVAGTYTVAAVFTKAHDYGINTLAIDGKAIGQPFDGYNSSVTVTSPISYGQVSLSAGQHQLTLTVTGKNSAAANYYAGIDYLTFAPAGDPATLVEQTSYIWNDAVSANWNGVTGTYLIDFPASSLTEDAANSVHTGCQYISYDGKGYATGQQNTLTLGEVTTDDHYTSCGTSANNFTTSGLLRTTAAYDQYGNVVASTDADANAGIGGHVGCTVGSTQYSTCLTYDGTHTILPVSSANALNQQIKLAYTASASGGFGFWPTSVTDLNGQTTSLGYDALGRSTSTTLPGETSGLTTTSTTYTVWCSGTSAQTPCVEVDTTQRLDSGTTVTSRAFYNGWGQLVETRSSAPGSQDVVQYANYDPSGRQVFVSIPYFVSAYTGGPGSAAFAAPDASQPGTSTTYTNLRSTTVKDARSFATTTTLSVACGQFNDSACYEITTTVDPLNHQKTAAADALGRQVFSSTYTGNSSSTYAVYATTIYWYDLQGNVVQIVEPNGSSSITYTYDDAGRKTGMTDPDRGQESYSYDQNGNLTESVDARGSAGTVFMGYDGLDRPLWRNTTNSPSGAYVTYSYDSTANGNMGIGRLTGETFSGGPNRSLSGSYSYVYDVRGREISKTLTAGGTSYPLQTTYNDAGQVLTETYPTGEVVTNNYTNEGWLGGVTQKQGSTTTTLLGNVSYSGVGGAFGQMTGASLAGSTYTYTASYDLLGRLNDTKLTRTSNSLLLFEQARTFDGAGNVIGITTTLPQGTDVQQFCYDEQNRLTWAGAVGTPPCTGKAITPGTLTAAEYTQTFSYDTLDRLTSGPLGSYTYGDSAHLHSVTSIGTSYSVSYDASGNMTCRATTSSTTCAGSNPTGAQLRYDNEGQLISWRNAPTNPTSQTADLYDGEGERVEQQVTQGGTTTTTVYVGDVEESSTTGSQTTNTTYYYAENQRIALAVNGVFSYLATDGLGSVTVALDANGNAQASVLYAPYGLVRYSSGGLPTDYGFTGQHGDAVTGLDYYGARYYDPQAGQFTSADTWLAGLNRCGYVSGNPETLTDPNGHNDECNQPTIGDVLNTINNLTGLALNAIYVAALAALLSTSPSGGNGFGGPSQYMQILENVVDMINGIPNADDDTALGQTPQGRLNRELRRAEKFKRPKGRRPGSPPTQKNCRTVDPRSQVMQGRKRIPPQKSVTTPLVSPLGAPRTTSVPPVITPQTTPQMPPSGIIPAVVPQVPPSVVSPAVTFNWNLNYTFSRLMNLNLNDGWSTYTGAATWITTTSFNFTQSATVTSPQLNLSPSWVLGTVW